MIARRKPIHVDTKSKLLNGLIARESFMRIGLRVGKFKIGGKAKV